MSGAIRRTPPARGVLALLTASSLLVGCGDSGTTSDEAAGRGGLERPCPEVSHSTESDPLALATALIDAAQAGDQEAVCALVGRAEVPNGLIEYADAVEGGLSKDIELDATQHDAAANTYTYRFVVTGSDTVLGIALQKQDAGWVVLMAPFLP